MGISVLGPLAVDGVSVTLTRRDRIVLAALAMTPGEALSAERLADALWTGRPPTTWNKVVQGCVMRLRRLLGAQTIETLPQGYRLSLPADEVDMHRFERLLGRASELLALGEPDRARFVADEALILWRGRPLLDLVDWDAGRMEGSRLTQRWQDAQELRVEAAIKAGEQVVAEAQLLVDREPLRERRWALLALALYRAGRQGEALRTLRQVRRVLDTQLGIEPSSELVELERAILNQDDSLLPVEALAAQSEGCPYPGLVPYQVLDSDTFFGREMDTGNCMNRLAERQIVAVVGPSGCGKSSLVRAGVAATLRQQGEKAIVVSPGAHPLDVLSALETSRSPATLIVDQFEEAFSLCDDSEERAHFFDALIEYAATSGLVIALRADRLGEFSAYPAMAQLIERGLYLLSAMDDAELRAAITGPARQAGLLLEPGLIDLLVREVEGEPGALPLLSHALRQAWERREGRTITVAGYQETGGIRGAVAKSAEDVYEAVPAQDRPLLRDLLLRLVTSGSEGEPVRGPVARRLLASDPQHEELIELLVGARLVTSDAGVVELAHEALARAWPRLRGWLDDDSEGQRIRRHLTGAADAWDALGRPDTELYRGVRLRQTLEWRKRATPDLTAVEMAFIAAGEALAEEERQEAYAQAQRQRRVNRRLRGLLAGVAALLLVSAVAGIAAVRQADRAREATVAADARRVGTQALVESDIDQSLLLAVAANHLDDSPETRASLLSALSKAPELIHATRGVGKSFYSMAVSSDGNTLAVRDDANFVWFYDATTLEFIGSYDANLPKEDDVRSFQYVAPLAFSPDGPILAIGIVTLDQPPVTLLDAHSFEESDVQLGGMPTRQYITTAVTYSANGRYLAVVFQAWDFGEDHPSLVLVWDMRHPEAPAKRYKSPLGMGAVDVALSPNGRVVYIVTENADRSALHAYSADKRQSLPIPRGSGAEISPDGSLFAFDDQDAQSIVVADALTGQAKFQFTGNGTRFTSKKFSNDGSMLAAASDDRTVTVWDLETGLVLETLSVGAADVYGLGFSADDSLLYTAGPDRALLSWDLKGSNRFIPREVRFDLASEALYALASPAGDRIAYPLRNGGLQVADVDSGRIGSAISTGHREFGAVAWTPDGTRIATSGQDGFVRLWDARKAVNGIREKALIMERRLAAGPSDDLTHIASVDYTLDGNALIVGTGSGNVSMVDAETLKPLGESRPR